MYDDNAWPDTAPITVFIEKRKRPRLVDVAAYALGVAAAGHLLASTMYGTAVGTAPEAVVLSDEIPTWLMITVSVLLTLGAAAVIVGLLRGRRWAPLTGRVTGGIYGAACGVFGLSVMPPSGAPGAGFAWFYAIIGFIVAIGGLVALGALFAPGIDAFFAPPQQQPTQFGPTGPDTQPLGGYDRDWIPPTQDGQNPPQQPPYPPYNR